MEYKMKDEQFEDFWKKHRVKIAFQDKEKWIIKRIIDLHNDESNRLEKLVKPKIAEEDKNEIIDLLSLFISYGRIHTVKGVSYFQGTHEEAINRAEKLRDKISNFSE